MMCGGTMALPVRQHRRGKKRIDQYSHVLRQGWSAVFAEVQHLAVVGAQDQHGGRAAMLSHEALDAGRNPLPGSAR